jgi:hypothetical protein
MFVDPWSGPGAEFDDKVESDGSTSSLPRLDVLLTQLL